MADIQLGCYTIKSHGAKLARLHMYDWIILILLAVLDGLLNIIEPFHRFVGKDMMTDLRYPLKGNTVPFWAVPIIGIVLPCVVFGGIYFKKKNFYDLHHGILGILYSVLITAVITDAIKDGVGRPRPDFFWRCFPDGKDGKRPTAFSIFPTQVSANCTSSLLSDCYQLIIALKSKLCAVTSTSDCKMWMRKKKVVTARPAARRRMPTSLGGLWRRVVGPPRVRKTRTTTKKSKTRSLSRALMVFSCVRGHRKGRTAARRY